MKTFLHFLLTIGAVAAAPAASSASGGNKHLGGILAGHKSTDLQHSTDRVTHETKHEDRNITLREIIDNVEFLNKTESKIHYKLVNNTFHKGKCSDEKLCTAGKILKEYTAKDLGLQEDKWRLPRLLDSYSKGNCANTETKVQMQLKEFLEELRDCTQTLILKHTA